MISKLDPNAAKLFCGLWIFLLNHVNQAYNVNPKLSKMALALDGLPRGEGEPISCGASRGH